MKVGRNEPCPCGSGKKYKKCCLQKDDLALMQARIDGDVDPKSPPPPPVSDHPFKTFTLPEEFREMATDPEEQEHPVWQAFDEANFNGKIAIIESAFANPEIREDMEFFFEFFYELDEAADDPEKRQLYHDLCLRLKEKEPEIYEAIISLLLNTLTGNLMADGRTEEAGRFFMELAAMAGEDIDAFNDRLDQMVWYGDLDVLARAMQDGWEGVKVSDEISQWSLEEFAGRAAEYGLFAYLARTSDPNPEDLEMLGWMNRYFEVIPDIFNVYFDDLTGRTDRKWTLEDFMAGTAAKKGGAAADEKIQENIVRLTNRFLGYLGLEAGVPWARAEMIRTEINRYLLERLDGELDEHPSEFVEALEKAKSKALSREYDHILCPDAKTLNRFIANKFHMLGNQPYRAAACFEALPHWFRFLESAELADAETCRKATGEIAAEVWPPLEELVLRLCKDGKHVAATVRTTWGNAISEQNAG